MKMYITGLGIISRVGNNKEDFWAGINNPEASRKSAYACPVELPKTIPNNVARRMDRFSRMTLIASMMAMEDSSLQERGFDPFRVGTVMNSGYGPIDSIHIFWNKLLSDGVEVVSPTVFASTVNNSGVGHTCIQLNLKGASTVFMGSDAVGYSGVLIEGGKADAILCGGVEEYCQELNDCYSELHVVDPDPDCLCRPLDRTRNGLRLTEGSAVLILENESIVEQNPDLIYCQVAASASAMSYTYPGIEEASLDPSQFVSVMRSAIELAGIGTSDIAGILMAAGGGRQADLIEAKAIKEVFGDLAAGIPVTSIKGAIGENFGASMNLNIAAGALTIRHGMMPMTVGCTEPDPVLGLDIVHTEPRKGDYRYILVNGYDISGCIFSTVLASAGR
ncbi:beta-ketoacyl-[acyl-carrier-protein] synthase family protein [Gorillibacterium sp. sgz500922]|uniref:beta-ketoacyl-[acyl-carrier-protein] synthase family protein n=1 Tax=Gorillibacterium sp. sgz500922 TaxID=3446694 RepID=UPI003F670602